MEHQSPTRHDHGPCLDADLSMQVMIASLQIRGSCSILHAHSRHGAQRFLVVPSTLCPRVRLLSRRAQTNNHLPTRGLSATAQNGQAGPDTKTTLEGKQPHNLDQHNVTALPTGPIGPERTWRAFPICWPRVWARPAPTTSCPDSGTTRLQHGVIHLGSRTGTEEFFVPLEPLPWEVGFSLGGGGCQ